MKIKMKIKMKNKTKNTKETKTKNKANANKNGKSFEKVVLRALVRKFKLPVLSQDEYDALAPDAKPANCLLTNSAYVGHRQALGWNNKTNASRASRTEFVVLVKSNNNSVAKMRIECKSQKVCGSVNEKLPSTIIDLQNYIPENESFLVVDGAELERNIAYLRAMSKQIFPGPANPKKNISVGTLPDLLDYIKI